MIILGIETSCDETAISIVDTAEINGVFGVKILANEILSQIDLHRQYGGVFPMLAKREHAKNLVPLFLKALSNAQMLKTAPLNTEKTETEYSVYSNILKNIGIDERREPLLWENFFSEIPKIQKPKIDLIAVTEGPGLEPALWTGINFAKALSEIWKIPLTPINHMEGHIFASLLNENVQIAESPNYTISKQKPTPQPETVIHNSSFLIHTPRFPAIALLVSGGHTELIKMDNWFKYELIGSTRDDAVGEAFDKVARILGLQYPGGPEISRLAANWRESGKKGTGITLPRPMINSDDFDFSFSGIKTAVLYLTKKLGNLTSDLKEEIAAEFETAAVETLVAKTKKALTESDAKSLIVGGGVAANKFLRSSLKLMCENQNVDLFISQIAHSTDNALMIATAAAFREQKQVKTEKKEMKAIGNLTISNV